jgi:PPOX class probable F420-dependent enzyme
VGASGFTRRFDRVLEVRLAPFARIRRVAEISDDVRRLFEGANFGHVATLMPDGSPHTVAVWVGLERDRVAFFTQTQSQKACNLARDGRVAVSITDHDNPYRGARIRGRLAEMLEGDEALEVIDRLSERYTGQPFPMRSGVVFLIEPERVGFMELPFADRPGGEERR